jgi:hypothetical protein
MGAVSAASIPRGAPTAKSFTSRSMTEGEFVRGVHTLESTSITVAAAAALWLKRGELRITAVGGGP